MARDKSQTPKSRLNLDLPERVRERLEDLRDVTSAESMTEVIRRALAVYDALIMAQEEGDIIIIRTREGQETRVLLP